MDTETIDPEVTALLREAAEWRLLGLLFEYPSEAWREQLAALLPDIREEDPRAMAQAALAQASPGLHHALFGPGGCVPVREAACQGGVQFGYLMAELAAYYEAFGYRPAAGEADDHLAVELGFLAYLKMKQALALATGEADAAAVTAEAAARFVRDHLCVMAEPAARALGAQAPDYLAAAGQRLLERTGPAPRSAFPAALPDRGEDAEELSCGSAPPDGELVRLAP